MILRLRAASGWIVAVAAFVVLCSGTAVAATGGSFILGRANSASSQTNLSNSGSGPVLSLSTRAGQAPLAVSSSAGKAPNLNADKLDGFDGAQFQRRIAGTCPTHYSIRAIGLNGTVTCDDQRTFVLEASANDIGSASVYCPQTDYVPVGGSSGIDSQTSNGVAFATSSGIATDTDGRPYFFAVYRYPSGALFTGPVIVSVRCVYGIDATPTAGSAALGRQFAAARRER